MQTQNPLLDDFGRLMTSAFGAAQAMGDEAKAMARAQVEKMIADMDLVRREEFEVMKSLAETAFTRAEALAVRVEALEAQLAGRKT